MGSGAVLMYTTSWCPYCEQARQLLRSKGIAFEELDVDAEPQRRTEMFERSGGQYTVPQIFIGSQHIGGADELQALESTGGLAPLLAGR
ncbi:MAG TPA: glutaredoxin 3 [Steroidobacteraceae bacterium]|nr:glutaredoxin 3 [Steroidobacteraceae bacterium]